MSEEQPHRLGSLTTIKSKVRSTLNKGTFKQRKDTRSVTHADSPVYLDAGRATSSRMSGPLDDIERRIINKLDLPAEVVDRKKLLKKQLSEENGSIEGRIEDVNEEDAYTIRKYLERNIEHQKKNEFIYTKEDVKDHKSVKSVLSRRTEFN